MPTRVIRGEILTSDSLSRVSMQAEFIFWRLFVAADDFGRLDGRPGVLRSVIFPTRDDVTLGEIERWVDELTRCDPDGRGPVQRYESGSRSYLQLRNWEKHRANGKRALKSRFPEPPEIPADPLGDSRGSADPHPSDVRRLTSDEGRLAPMGAPEPPAAVGAVSGPSKREALKRAPGKAPGQEAVAIFCEEFKAARGVNPAVPPKDARALHDLHRQIGPERLRAAARVYMHLADDFVRKALFAPAVFVARITQCDETAQMRAPPVNGHAGPAEDEAETLRRWREIEKARLENR